MMEDNNYLTAFQIITYAGDARSASLLAIQAARTFDFANAEDHLGTAEKNMRQAHQLQIDMIQAEAAGNPVEVNIILVHAQDHLSMAMMAKDNAEEFVQLYRMIQELKGEK